MALEGTMFNLAYMPQQKESSFSHCLRISKTPTGILSPFGSTGSFFHLSFFHTSNSFKYSLRVWWASFHCPLNVIDVQVSRRTCVESLEYHIWCGKSQFKSPHVRWLLTHHSLALSVPTSSLYNRIAILAERSITETSKNPFSEIWFSFTAFLENRSAQTRLHQYRHLVKCSVDYILK